MVVFRISIYASTKLRAFHKKPTTTNRKVFWKSWTACGADYAEAELEAGEASVSVVARAPAAR
jgi:hypothetical protein